MTIRGPIAQPGLVAEFQARLPAMLDELGVGPEPATQILLRQVFAPAAGAG